VVSVRHADNSDGFVCCGVAWLLTLPLLLPLLLLPLLLLLLG
jgi:hypothetical protein